MPLGTSQKANLLFLCCPKAGTRLAAGTSEQLLPTLLRKQEGCPEERRRGGLSNRGAASPKRGRAYPETKGAFAAGGISDLEAPLPSDGISPSAFPIRPGARSKVQKRISTSLQENRGRQQHNGLIEGEKAPRDPGENFLSDSKSCREEKLGIEAPFSPKTSPHSKKTPTQNCPGKETKERKRKERHTRPILFRLREQE